MTFLFTSRISLTLIKPRSRRIKNRHYSTGIPQDDNTNNDFNTPLYDSHIPTNSFQKFILAAGSSLTALTDPWRADMVAVSGEVTGASALKYVRDTMASSSEGKLILKQRPRINTQTVDFEALKNLPSNTLGYNYNRYNEQWKITPDSRDTVSFVDDEELAYVMQRYREIHDITHMVLDMPTNMVGEVAVKWVEGIQTGLPMCIGGAILGPLRFTPKQKKKYEKILPWAIRVGINSQFLMNIYFEQRWEQDLDEFRYEMKIEQPPKIK